jgi:hypothetical protein
MVDDILFVLFVLYMICVVIVGLVLFSFIIAMCADILMHMFGYGCLFGVS